VPKPSICALEDLPLSAELVCKGRLPAVYHSVMMGHDNKTQMELHLNAKQSNSDFISELIIYVDLLIHIYMYIFIHTRCRIKKALLSKITSMEVMS